MTARQLAADHLWLVHAYAKKLCGTLCHNDLCSVGHVALMEAAKRWRAFHKNHPQCQFRQYAGQRIKWRMLDAVRRHKELPQEPELHQHDGADYCANGRNQNNCFRLLDSVPSLNGDDLDDRAHIHGLLRRLPDLEQRALMLSYGIGRRTTANVEQIAAKLNLSARQVRALMQSGIMRLRWDAVRGKA